MSEDYEVLEGWVSVRAVMVAGFRPVHKVFFERGRSGTSLDIIRATAKRNQVATETIDAAAFSDYVEGSTHGGVIALVGARRFLGLEKLGQGRQAAFIAMLEGIEDPYNFAQAIRALFAAGLHGLVVPPRNWMHAASLVARASAGASELLPIAQVASGLEAAEYFKTRGLQVICTASKGQTRSLYQADLSQPLFLVIGGERRGISKALLRVADTRLTIPYGRDFRQSLGAAAAASVIGFEVLRQRHHPS